MSHKKIQFMKELQGSVYSRLPEHLPCANMAGDSALTRIMHRAGHAVSTQLMLSISFKDGAQSTRANSPVHPTAAQQGRDLS